MTNVHLIDHPLVQHKLTLMRRKDASTNSFRRLLNELAMLMAYEVTRDVGTQEIEIETPLETMRAKVIDGKKLVFVSILRAGTGILEGMLSVVPGARVGHIGLYRDPKTLTAIEYYFKLPGDMHERDVIVVDPMLATGNTAIAAVERIKETRPKSIKFVCLLTCPEGIKAFQAAHSDVAIYTAAIDRELNSHGYILPGLGDAGDRIFGTKGNHSLRPPPNQQQEPRMNKRRQLLIHTAAIAALSALAMPGLTFAQAKLKVAAIYTVPFEQQWVSRIHKALKAAEARGDIEYKATENVANADYERVMREYVAGGNQLIVGEAFAVEAAARKVAKDSPKVSFLMGSSGKPQAPNFSVFDNYIQEPAYLSGMIAGSMTKSNKIGMVGGFPIPEVTRLMHAFMAGAKETNPKVEFTVSFINSWFDPPKAKEATFAMIDKGADVLYAERFGVSDAAKEKGKLAIGNVINTQDKYPDTVVASALWNMEPSIDEALKLVKTGKFVAADYGKFSTMKYKGSELAPLGTFATKVPAEIVKKVAAKQADILSGKFTVKVDDTTPKSTAK